jgi:hypothetical protein
MLRSSRPLSWETDNGFSQLAVPSYRKHSVIHIDRAAVAALMFDMTAGAGADIRMKGCRGLCQ